MLQIDPKDAESRFQMAEALSKQGKIEAAFKEYSSVVAGNENHVMARVRVGQLLLLNRMVDDAEKMAGEALAKEPNNVEAWFCWPACNRPRIITTAPSLRSSGR